MNTYDFYGYGDGFIDYFTSGTRRNYHASNKEVVESHAQQRGGLVATYSNYGPDLSNAPDWVREGMRKHYAYLSTFTGLTA